MNGIELGNFLQNLVDEDVIESVDTDRLRDAFGKYNLLKLKFNRKLRFAVIDEDGNMIPFDCDCIEYSSRKLIEFLADDTLYLSRAIDEIANIHWN